MSVTRCICRNVSFAEILALHAKGLTLAQIKDRTGCAGGCGTCEPYIRLAIVTRTADLPVLTGRRLADAARLDPDAVLPSRDDHDERHHRP